MYILNILIYIMGFVDDLKFGNKYEDIAIKELIDNGYELKEKAPNKYFPDYDFIMTKNNIDIKYEVKADRQAFKYGNIAIETENNNKISSLLLSKADFYIYYIIKPDNTHIKYIIPVSILKQFIADNLYNRLVKKVFNKPIKLYLFKIDLFDKYKIDDSEELENKKAKIDD